MTMLWPSAAATWPPDGRLKTGDLMVTTVMANLGLDKALGRGHPHRQDPGGRPLRARGDGQDRRHLGGEQSGHLLFLDHSPTGDGIVSALQLLAVMRETGQPFSALAACMSKFPQVLVNVPVREKPASSPSPGWPIVWPRARASWGRPAASSCATRGRKIWPA